MIDTHLHILPGVDDGPETIEEALALNLRIGAGRLRDESDFGASPLTNLDGGC